MNCHNCNKVLFSKFFSESLKGDELWEWLEYLEENHGNKE